jgi:hydrogenase nickel incorporation protein HypA/HybF
MLNQIDAIAAQHHASSVTKVTLRVGPLSGVEPQLLLQAFPLASAGTIASDATLVIESLPIRVRCRGCEKESEVSINRLTCRHCGDYQTQVISGDEMLLANLELNTND